MSAFVFNIEDEEFELVNGGYCECCGDIPRGEIVVASESTDWCRTCFEVNGDIIPEEILSLASIKMYTDEINELNIKLNEAKANLAKFSN